MSITKLGEVGIEEVLGDIQYKERSRDKATIERGPAWPRNLVRSQAYRGGGGGDAEITSATQGHERWLGEGAEGKQMKERPPLMQATPNFISSAAVPFLLACFIFCRYRHFLAPDKDRRDSRPRFIGMFVSLQRTGPPARPLFDRF